MHEKALSSEYLVITGRWIKDMLLARRIDLSPVNYTFQVQAMSADERPVILPATLTVGPSADDHDSLLKYARLVLSSHDTTSTRIIKLVEGETRAPPRAVSTTGLGSVGYLGRTKLELEGYLYAKKKEAEGPKAKGPTYNYSPVRDYLMIKGELFQDLAKSNAVADGGSWWDI
ncbi:hypothetical protein SASPL_136249 [Salvia splendens]|uniref:Flotillin-like n=1 Tax=Salvia splendens TaxID=180675 RepID=A0A8X8X0J2_SALSN|nr:hypothetical protein SASPL_136249 [Salvia splendens]